MPTDMLETVIKYWNKHRIWAIAPFMNGEYLLDERGQTTNNLIQQHTKAITIVDTNGSEWRNRQLLVHPNLKIVRFTISAATKETYKQVHGVDRFDDAVKTFRWFLKNRLPQQQVMLHYIVNKHNEHEIEDYIQMFKGTKIRIFALHDDGKHQKASQNAWGKTEYHPPIIIEPNGKRHFEYPHKNMPCQCWDILGIGPHGEIMQCVDFPYKFNYGNVADTDMMTAWKKRLENKMDNECCNGCNLRVSNWRKIIDKYIP
jgi:MoaA/NifB/PqqE/SkfB family radical SAM enzyme